MSMKRFSEVIIIVLLALTSSTCEDMMEPEAFTVNAVFSAVKSGDVDAEYHDGTIPTGEELESPYTFSQSRVVNGKDILVSVTVPEDTSELYISIDDPHASYFNVQMEDDSQNVETGYFVLNTDDIQTDSDKEKLLGFSHYLLVISTLENAEIDGYDFVISYKTPSGYSRAKHIFLNAMTLAPYQKQLKVGFSPPSVEAYTLTIRAPDGKVTQYIDDGHSGAGTFDNSQSPDSFLSYDSGSDMYWIELEPIFGTYTLTLLVQVEAVYNNYIVVELPLTIYSAGKIDRIVPEFRPLYNKTSTNLISGVFELDFDYLSELAPIEVESLTATILSPNTVETKQVLFEGMVQHPFNPSNTASKGGPGNHLPIYMRDVVDMDALNQGQMEYTPIEVLLSADLLLPPGYTEKDLSESWTLDVFPQGVTRDILKPIGLGHAILKVPPLGGEYKVSYKPTAETPSSEANIVLPLSGADITNNVYDDIQLADEFASKVQESFPGGFCLLASTSKEECYTMSELYMWFRDDGNGDYLGRPNNVNSQTVWIYNEVSTNRESKWGQGAIATWFGMPIRIAKVSNFLVGYTMEKIDVPPSVQLPAQLEGNKSDPFNKTSLGSFYAGVNLAKNKIEYGDIETLVYDMYNDKFPIFFDTKVTKLWPNVSEVDNFATYTSLFNPDYEYTNPGFLYIDP